MRTVFKEGANKGRKFWKCANGEGPACIFWEWDDRPPRNYGSIDDVGDAGAKSFSISSPNRNSASGGADVCFKARFLLNSGNSC